ncbi:MAG: hypothetical protein ABF747_02250 [Bifidobacterium sp.]|uniref:hypothetical protein n=1 Tax=Bifidobacterium sp. TaxID=41200 RepID=UPI0039E83603
MAAFGGRVRVQRAPRDGEVRLVGVPQVLFGRGEAEVADRHLPGERGNVDRRDDLARARVGQPMLPAHWDTPRSHT